MPGIETKSPHINENFRTSLKNIPRKVQVPPPPFATGGMTLSVGEILTIACLTLAWIYVKLCRSSADNSVIARLSNSVD